ncbi:MAG: hypothetical protein U5K31_13190 [Balneolaceae bacterium]|nr:hypothetical protein [Balneolaceae bacterium]
MTARPTAYLFVLALLLPSAASAQVADTTHTAADSLASDSLQVQRPDSAASDSAGLTVRPWDFHPSLGAEKLASDSTLRWQIWPDLSYLQNTRPGVITYRLGTMGRSSGIQDGALEARYQELFWENIPMNDPVSGTFHGYLLPHNKLLAAWGEDAGGARRTRYFLKPWYLLEPLSRISYQESTFDNRSLEFMVSHNLSRRTNAEISYWDRRDGGAYSNSGVQGRQIFARLFHQLGPREALKLQFSSDAYTAGEPFGYLVGDPLRYNFNRFTTSAREPGGESETGSNVLALQYYRRPADSARTQNDLQAGIWYRGTRRELSWSADTLSYKTPVVGASLRRWWEEADWSAEAGARTIHLFQGGGSAYTGGYLAHVEGDAALRAALLPRLEGRAEAGAGWRSDSYGNWRLQTGLQWNRGGDLGLSASAFAGRRMPTPQQLYWSSQGYDGNPDLETEGYTGYRAVLHYQILPRLEGSTTLEFKHLDGAVMADITADSAFLNTSAYWSSAAVTRLAWESEHLELSGSATLHAFSGEGPGFPQKWRGARHRKLWLRWGAWWKGYLFGRATYVKAGVSGMASGLNYRPDTYLPELDFWQPAGGSGLLPRFHRLDAELSARVRTIMITLRWENVLEDVTQAGYFETLGRPMHGRRLLFGIRAQFRN